MKELGETLYKKWVSPNHFPYTYNKAAGQGEALARVGVRGLAPLPPVFPASTAWGKPSWRPHWTAVGFRGGAGGAG
jgi:hypothetical protein